MIANGGFRWIRARLKAVTGHRAKLESAPAADLSVGATAQTAHKAQLETRPAADAAVGATAQTAHKAALSSAPSADLKAGRIAKSRVCAKLVAYLTAPMRAVWRAGTRHKAELDAAPGQSMASGRRNSTRLTAIAETAPSADIAASSRSGSRCKAVLEGAPSQDGAVGVTAQAGHKALLDAADATDLLICALPRISVYAKLTYAWAMEFYNYDGSKLLYNTITRPGEDCEDPVAEGLIDAPTRPSDERYHYPAFSGWTTVKGGDAQTGGEMELILAETKLTGFAYSSQYGAYHLGVLPSPYTLADGQEYIIVWDGTEVVRTAFAYTYADGSECIAVGNSLAVGGEDNGDKFCVVYDATNNYLHYFSVEAKTEHRAAIYRHSADSSSDPLKNVTEARELYAAYEKELRYYSAKFYDAEGELLGEAPTPYGEQALPPDTTRTGYIFAGWTPSDLTVTGDCEFVGKWEKIPAVDILPETVLTLSASPSYGGTYQQKFTLTETIVSGSDYTVVFDGVEYPCRARDIYYSLDNTFIPEMLFAAALGNATLITQVYGIAATTAEADTGEPFVTYSVEGADWWEFYVICKDNDEHKIRIYYEP